MQALNILLFNALHGNKPHVGSLHGFTNGFSIVAVVLVALDKGFDELRADELNMMPHAGEMSGPVVSAGASLHRDAARWLLKYKGTQLVAHQTATKHNPAIRCSAVQLEDILGNINGQNSGMKS